MNLQELLTHCKVDTKAMKTEGYDSWAPNDDTVILTISDYDGSWQRVNYIQLIDPVIMYNDSPGLELIMQLDGHPESPKNTTVLESISIRIFKEVK